MNSEMIYSGKEYDAIKKSGAVGDRFYCCAVYTPTNEYLIAVPHGGHYFTLVYYDKYAM